MSEQHGTAHEWAEIERIFAATGQGLVLMLKDGFSGIIPTNGTVRGERGASAYDGPKFVEDWDASGAPKGWMAVVATAGDAAQFFRPGDAVAFFSQLGLRDRHRAVGTIELHAQGWNTVLDFYDALLTAIGAPDWHGKSIDALIDSMVWGGINSVEPPYKVQVYGVGDLASDTRRAIEQVEQVIEQGGTDFLQRRGHNPGVSLKIVS